MKQKQPLKTREFEKFEALARKIVSVPKTEIDKRLADEKKAKETQKKRGK